MSGRILDGRAIASRSWRELSDRVDELVASGQPAPRLAVIRFTDSGPAAVYAASVARAARSIGIEVVDVRPADGSPRSDVAARIGALNRDPTIAGIVVSQPLPSGLEGRPIVDEIDPAKDVDGATQASAGRLARGGASFVPATALAVLEILRGYDIPLAGRRAVVVGRSAVVGRPTAALLTAADATVVLCHRGTRNLARETRRAEILVAAAGVPGLIQAHMVNRSAVIIDCGINVGPGGIVGDVDFETVRPVVAAITPVPGGVGPVTTMMVLAQTVTAAERIAGADDPERARFELPAGGRSPVTRTD
jgi:methylenetetrahydrofolate dehydrogenase (NADP+)/methenyltetrahydrofolate cyclohydrolase